MSDVDRTKPGTIREDRLKAALRDNLRRRKAQARGRTEADERTGSAQERSDRSIAPQRDE